MKRRASEDILTSVLTFRTQNYDEKKDASKLSSCVGVFYPDRFTVHIVLHHRWCQQNDNHQYISKTREISILGEMGITSEVSCSEDGPLTECTGKLRTSTVPWHTCTAVATAASAVVHSADYSDGTNVPLYALTEQCICNRQGERGKVTSAITRGV